MSLDASLKIKSDKGGNRNVYTRAERFKKLMEEERWSSEKGVLGMPKVRVFKVAVKKKEAKAEAGAEGAAPAAGGKAAAPAAGGKAAAPAKDAGKKADAGAKKEAGKK